MVWVRALRSVSAWALPRPSATASARFANTTVAHSHAAMAQANTDGCTAASTVVSTEPTQTTNITGDADLVARVELAQRLGQGLDELPGAERPCGGTYAAGT